MRLKETKKLCTVRECNYIEQGHVDSLTHLFLVDKGTEGDIRMVYNGTSSGLNDALWAPHFTLPTVQTQLRSLVEGTHMADLDIGEMFLNFMLHKTIRAFYGVDVKFFQSTDPDFEVGRPSDWEHWCRDMMGLMPSPFLAIQQLLWGKEWILGDQQDEQNPFAWDSVELNLPKMPGYDPTKPWVAKIKKGGGIAPDVFIYVDVRVTGQENRECWRASQWFSSRCNFLGVQSAPQKSKRPDREQGPWAGTTTHTKKGVKGMVLQSKWDKTKLFIAQLREIWEKDPNNMPRKELESIHGFLIYVVQTYRDMNSYLKGLHLTIDGWRSDCDGNRWKLRGKDFLAAEHEGKIPVIDDGKDAPSHVKAVPRMKDDLEALERLTSMPAPPTQPLRAEKHGSAWYMVGDASGKGFGSALFVDNVLEYETGDWGGSEGAESSNWRESENLVDRIIRAVKERKLQGAELFLFTDNEVFEGTFYRGNSTSRKLFELVLKLHEAAMKGKLILHVIHIAGTWMKVSGIDGLTRRELEGMMAGGGPLMYLPLAKGVLERSNGRVEEWI